MRVTWLARSCTQQRVVGNESSPEYRRNLQGSLKVNGKVHPPHLSYYALDGNQDVLVSS